MKLPCLVHCLCNTAHNNGSKETSDLNRCSFSLKLNIFNMYINCFEISVSFVDMLCYFFLKYILWLFFCKLDIQTPQLYLVFDILVQIPLWHGSVLSLRKEISLMFTCYLKFQISHLIHETMATGKAQKKLNLSRYFELRKVPEFSDVRKLCCNLPKIQEKRPNLWVFRQKDATEIANSGDPDQTAPLGAV